MAILLRWNERLRHPRLPARTNNTWTIKAPLSRRYRHQIRSSLHSRLLITRISCGGSSRVTLVSLTCQTNGIAKVSGKDSTSTSWSSVSSFARRGSQLSQSQSMPHTSELNCADALKVNPVSESRRWSTPYSTPPSILPRNARVLAPTSSQRPSRFSPSAPTSKRMAFAYD